MDEQPKPKVPIVAKRQFSKPVTTRLSVEELAAITKAKQAQAEQEQAAAEAKELAKSAPAPEQPLAPREDMWAVPPTASAVKSKSNAKSSPEPSSKSSPRPEPKPEPKPIIAAAASEPAPIAAVAEPQAIPEPTPVTAPAESRPVPEQPDQKTTANDETAEPKPAKKVPRHSFSLQNPLPRVRSAVSSQLRRIPGYTSLNKPSLDTWLVLGCTVLVVGNQLALLRLGAPGMIVTMITILLLTLLALFRETQRKLAISLLILPVSQMLSSTIITHNAFQTASILYMTILALTLAYRYLFTLDEPVEKTRLGWMGHLLGLPLMLILGQLLGALDYGFVRNHYEFTHIALPLVFASCIVFAFAEEMLLRGLIQQQASRTTNRVVSILLPSALYTVLAINTGMAFSVIPAIVTGTVLAVAYDQKRNLLLTIAVNAAFKLAYVGLVATFVLR